MGGHLVAMRPTKSGLGGVVATFVTDSGKLAHVGLSKTDMLAIQFYGLAGWFPLKSHANGRWLVWRINWKEID